MVVINFRGLGGAELATPKLHNYGAWEDALEPMTYVYERYCKHQNRKAFAIGLSMGGNILANLAGNQGHDCFLSACCFVEPPIKISECVLAIGTNFFGIYDKALGDELN